VSILTAVYDEDVAKMVWQEEAREDTRDEERTNFAKNLISYNRPIEEIIDCTGLTSAEINQLIANG